MDVWVDEKKPEVVSTGNIVLAVLVHLVFFTVCFTFAKFHFKPKEAVIPIDLTVVVNENLDGEDDQPPPLDNPQPKVVTPPPPQPKTVEPPPPVNVKTPAVVQVRDKPEPKPSEKTAKQLEEERLKRIREAVKDPPREETQKKTVKQLEEERMARIRASVRPVQVKVKDRPSGNGKTERQTRTKEEIEKLLGQGYRPGATTQVAASEEQRCISLIRSAFYAKWDRPPWTDTLREMHLKVKFGANGRVLGYQLVQSSGDRNADASVTRAAAQVTQVVGLSESFIAKNSRDGVIIRFKVTPQ